MSVRRKTDKRFLLHRQCGTCGKWITTTAASPWMRQVPRDGKKQAITYFCSSKCFAASYKHIGWYDGKCWQRKKERDAKRDQREKNWRYYATHREQELERARQYRLAHPEEVRVASAYSRQKRNLLQEMVR